MRGWVFAVVVLVSLGLVALEVIASHRAPAPAPTHQLLLK